MCDTCFWAVPGFTMLGHRRHPSRRCKQTDSCSRRCTGTTGHRTTALGTSGCRRGTWSLHVQSKPTTVATAETARSYVSAGKKGDWLANGPWDSSRYITTYGHPGFNSSTTTRLPFCLFRPQQSRPHSMPSLLTAFIPSKYHSGTCAPLPAHTGIQERPQPAHLYIRHQAGFARSGRGCTLGPLSMCPRQQRSGRGRTCARQCSRPGWR